MYYPHLYSTNTNKLICNLVCYSDEYVPFETMKQRDSGILTELMLMNKLMVTCTF